MDKLHKGRAFFFLFLLFTFSSYTVNPVNGEDAKELPSVANQVKTVVIDAGHGGKDPGCHGSYANEKDICLSLALKLGNYIKTHFPDVKVEYTRETDVFIELHNRAKIANEKKADLFICIHVNASGSTEAYGVETYIMGLHKSESNLEVAKRENETILLEDDYEDQYAGFDVNSPEGSVLFSFYQNTFLNQSLNFAGKLQTEFTNYASRHNRGVRQAGFLVLVKTTMPAVLIETGFLTNLKEEKFLTGTEGQELMTSAMFRAFIKYKAEVEGENYAGMAADFGDIAKDWSVSTSNSTPNTTPAETTQVETTPNVLFRIQFLSSQTSLDKTSSSFSGLKDILEETYNGWYRYLTGKESNYTKIQTYLETVKSKGYTDAFIVAYQGNERITVKKALEILEQ